MVWVLGLLALLYVLDHVVGAVLSFPSAKKWRQSFKLRKGAGGHKPAFDLHRTGGLWLVPVTLAVSGVYFNWHDTFEAAVNVVSPVTPDLRDTAPDLAEPRYDPPVTLDRALAVVRADSGGAAIEGAQILPDKGLYRVYSKDPRDLDGFGGQATYVDAASGEVVARRHARGATVGDEILAWMYPLHSGKVLDWPGRILICLTGIAVVTFAVTRVMIWLRKRDAKHGAAARRARTVGRGPVAAKLGGNG